MVSSSPDPASTPDWRSPRHLLAGLLAGITIAAGCANSAPQVSGEFIAAEGTRPPTVAFELDETPASGEADVSQGEPADLNETPATTGPAFPDGFRLPKGMVLPTTVPPEPGATTPGEVEQPSAPAPTLPNVRADPTSLYQGVLGRLGPNEQVAAPVADPPLSKPGTAPLTGLASSAISRAPIVIKIDNSSKARPQTGLGAADIIIEEEVEWGITRLAAVFHSAGADVGPVRSGRTTDIGYLGGLGSPVLAYSGANDVTEALLQRQAKVQNLGANRFGGYWRSSGRSAPHNLYTSTNQLWAAAQPAGVPAQFAYRDDGAVVAGSQTSGADIAFPSLRVGWSWTGTAWARAQAGSPHLTADGAQLQAANVVVVEVAEVPTGLKDSAGGVVPEYVFVGTGPATVLSGGNVVRGVWTRPSLADVATLTRPDGRVVELTAGVTWIEIITPGALTVR